MPISMKAEVQIMNDKSAQVLAKISGLTDEKLRVLAHDIVVQARENAAGLEFEESTGQLAREIHDTRIGDKHYQIETKSGHAAYIEFGTRYIEDKQPFLWPAYRSEKRKFFRGGKWI